MYMYCFNLKYYSLAGKGQRELDQNQRQLWILLLVKCIVSQVMWFCLVHVIVTVVRLLYFR